MMNAPDAEALERIQDQWRMAWVDATAIAARHGIGTPTSPIVNTTMVGAFAGATGLLRPEHVRAALEEVMGDAAKRNADAALEAFETVRILPSPIAGALQALFEEGGR